MDSTGAAFPVWDTADRMRKGLRIAGLESQEMADYLGVSRTSISNWINGRVAPSRQTLRLWALRTGVSYEWLCHGDAYPHRPGSAPARATVPSSTVALHLAPSLYLAA
jgi:transcriptional regulator with XRE-family HTH domain